MITTQLHQDLDLFDPQLARAHYDSAFWYTSDQFEEKLQRYLEWREGIIREVSVGAETIYSLGLDKLAPYFDRALLNSTKVTFMDPVPHIPLVELGLLNYQLLPKGESLGGISVGGQYILHPRYRNSVDLHLHELVHDLQWRILGTEAMLAYYVAGVLRYDYMGCPLEKCAYDLQDRFNRGEQFSVLEEVRASLQTIPF